MATIIGTPQADLLEGTEEGDTLLGLDGNDSLDGDDSAEGDAAADTLIGGKGDDSYYVDDSFEDTLYELPNEGNDTVYSSATFILGDDFENLVLTGTAENGTGNELGNILVGNENANTLDGRDGKDHLYGGEGNDTLTGGLGADTLDGGSGDDTYYVDDAEDKIVDASGEDDTVFSSINFNLNGLYIENAILDDNPDALRLIGNGLDNYLSGNDYDNFLNGGDGDDILDGGLGADEMSGGLGDDIFFVDDIADVVTESPDHNIGTALNPIIVNGGFDAVYSSVTFTLSAHVEALVLLGEDAIDGTGNVQRNILIGNDASNVLNGRGNDDIIDGGLAADTMIGELGNDIFYVDNAGDLVIENAGEGDDSVYASIDYTLESEVENLLLLKGNITGTGNASSNKMVSSSDADTLAGLAGDDEYYVQNTDDTIVETAGQGNDTVFSTASDFTLSDYIESLVLSGVAAINGKGNSAANTLTGNSSANILDGAGGADTMAGGLGDDTYYVDTIGDAIVELSGQGADTVKSSITYTLANHVENLTLTGTDDINGTGNASANTMTGNDGDNVLNAAGSAKDKVVDTLNGGLGADTLIGGKQRGDVFIFDSELGNGNVDTLADFKKDIIKLEDDIFESLDVGSLLSGNFVSGNGAVAIDINDFIIHDKTTGTLYYDKDGSGAEAAIAFAIVSGKLSYTDFIVFDSGI